MTRININGQGQSVRGGTIAIDRTFPGELSGAMSEYEWTSFCDKIDEALAPANSHRKIFMIAVFSVFALITIGILSVVFFGIRSSDDDVGNGIPKILGIAIPFFFAIMIVMIIFGCYISSKMRKVIGDADQVCEDESKKRPNVSFHFRVSIRMLVFFLIANRSILNSSIQLCLMHILWYNRKRE